MYSYSARGTIIGVSPDENPSDPVYYPSRSSYNGNGNNALPFNVVDAKECQEKNEFARSVSTKPTITRYGKTSAFDRRIVHFKVVGASL